MTASPESKPVPVFPILMVNFIGTLGFSIVLPFLVFIVTRFGGSAFVYGMLGATYSTFQFIGGPVLGRWSDVHGRKRILLLSQIGTLLSWVIFVIALYLPARTVVSIAQSPFGPILIALPVFVLFCARALDGLTGGNISVANAYLADITPPETRNENFGKMSMSANLGFVIGPALAGLLGGTALRETLPALAALLISLVAVFVIALRLPDSRHHTTTSGKAVGEGTGPSTSDPIRFRDVLRVHCVGWMLVLYFLIFLGFNFFYTAFPIHACVGLQWSVTQMGMFFALLSLMMVIVQGPVLKRASRKWRDGTLVTAGGLFLCVNFILLATNNERLVYVAAVFFALGNGLMWPSFLSLFSKVAGEKYQGSVQGFGASAGSVASIIGLISGGVLYSWIGTMTFAFSAAILLLVCILAIRVVRLERCDFRPSAA